MQSVTHANTVDVDAPAWVRMSADEYAAMQLAFGAKVVQAGGIWWRQVRKFFYRPLLPYRELNPEGLQYPPASMIGGVQFAVPDSVTPDSLLKLLLFENPHEYSLERLSQNNRYHVRRAMKKFSVRQISNVEEFIATAHPVYLSFYDRTKYGYRAERTDEQQFASWARTLFSFPQVRVLGAYREEELVSVSVSYLVEDVVFTATFFSRTEALNDYVSDLLLHVIRENSAANDDVNLIFASSAGMERGLDDFYLRRGAVLASKPARLKMNPFARMLLKTLKKDEYQKFGALK